jgi:hypothetical protein
MRNYMSKLPLAKQFNEHEMIVPLRTCHNWITELTVAVATASRVTAEEPNELVASLKVRQTQAPHAICSKSSSCANSEAQTALQINHA